MELLSGIGWDNIPSKDMALIFVSEYDYSSCQLANDRKIFSTLVMDALKLPLSKVKVRSYLNSLSTGINIINNQTHSICFVNY